ncbi:DUF4097 family beta strand repeat-containing protein [Poritiphilus flavus]|uniref:DUF4097 family beta strand repeat protein n=1 Tax=Poritiphilus flavus TaxID=2697053 RepID=A0A6L9E6N2_9FLAO|nr:DUF4097 family beta strand repeat-containing protein [Poritiphilus flavus]NAS10387.1 DUF4097 family beta strand repeat protein [Poritiphilus flavus]
MKTAVLCAALTATVGLQPLQAQKKEFKELIKKEVAFSGSGENNLIIKNVFGSIDVEGYDGSTVLFEIERKISARNTEDLELGKEELKVNFIEEANRIIVHPDAPYMNFKEDGLSFNWCWNNHDQPKYSHKLDFKVRVPRNTSLVVSTVNDGELAVSNTRGKSLKANNVNGGIELNNITGKTDVHAINGEVKISYAKNPVEASSYYSLNGDINIEYQQDLSAAIGFKSMNGELYTDFDISRQYSKTTKNDADSKGRFKFESRPIVQIGSGKLSHNFETLNGNVIITKN